VATAVLLVEDDALIASSLQRALVGRGYDVDAVATVADAIGAIDRGSPDLVLLDLGLPDGDGGDVAAHVAATHPAVPVIVLTARSSEVDVVLGLEAGAVDYVVKPFRLAELLARIDAHIRMRAAMHDEVGNGNAAEIVVGDVVVHVASRRVLVGGEEVALRPKEYDLLERLARVAGQVVTREQLIEDVWDENWWGSTKTLDVHVNSLRRKMGEAPGEPSRVTTIRGVGYRLERERPRG
jgi:DNA-binding response OmpR family regulator